MNFCALPLDVLGQSLNKFGRNQVNVLWIKYATGDICSGIWFEFLNLSPVQDFNLKPDSLHQIGFFDSLLKALLAFEGHQHTSFLETKLKIIKCS